MPRRRLCLLSRFCDFRIRTGLAPAYRGWMASGITAREVNLLLKPELFPTQRSVLEFNRELQKVARKNDVHYDAFDRIDAEIREVQFFDTPDGIFREKRVILRLRRDHSSGWPDESWEVTLKRPSPDFRESADFDVDTSMKDIEKRFKFKEELVRGEKAGAIKSIFSNNLIGYYPVVNFQQQMSQIIGYFPGLKALDLDPEAKVSAVNDARVFEIGARLGTYTFGKDTVAHADLAVWTRPTTDAFHVLVGEFGLSYHMKGEAGKQQKAHNAADDFFRAIQGPLKGSLFDGTTKTALIYGSPEFTGAT